MTVRRFLAVLVVALCIGVPAVEAIDSWDHTLQDGNDTEANLVVTALCVGVALITAIRVVTAISRVKATERSRLTTPPRFVQRRFTSLLPPVTAKGPPIALRI